MTEASSVNRKYDSYPRKKEEDAESTFPFRVFFPHFMFCSYEFQNYVEEIQLR